jgi:hypothetical protein
MLCIVRSIIRVVHKRKPGEYLTVHDILLRALKLKVCEQDV